MKILIADDSHVSRHLLEVFLKAQGHEVAAVANGREAWDRLQTDRVDLIISDIRMPVMDGFELCRSVRKDERFRDIPLIFHTATYTSRKDEAFALKIGADRFLKKPCELNELLKAIEEVMAAAAERHAPGSAPSTSEEEAFTLYSERLVRKLELSNIRLEAEARARQKAEEAARAAADSWQITFDAMLDPVAILETNGVIRQCNRAFSDFLGASPTAVIGERCFQLVHRTQGHIEGCPLLRSLQSGVRETMPMSVGGEEFVVVTDPIRGPNHEIKGLVHVMRNITDIKRTQEALRQSEERLKLAMEASNEGLWDWHLPSGKAVFSPRWYTMLGYAPDEFPASYESWRTLVHPDDIEETERIINEHIQDKTGYAVEFRLRTKSGGWRWIMSRGMVVELDGQGRPIRMVGTHTDITDRKEAEQRLRESEETYRNIFQNAQVGMYRTRISDGKILESNEQLARMFGYETREEFIAEYATGGNYVDPGTRERMLDEIRKNGFVRNFEARFYRKDRSIFWARYSARIYPDKGWIEGVAEDITETKAAEEEKQRLQAQLLQAQKIESVGRLAGGVAHDFNNMLGIILGYGEHLLTQFQEGDPRRKDVERILEAGKRSAALTRQLLAFARKQVISPRVLDLNDTVEQTLKMLRRLIGEDIDLVWLPGHGLWSVNMDPTQIDQILVNLAVNARDAIAGVGTVTIMTQNRVLDEAFCAGHPGATPGEYVMLGVEDNGCGMDEDTLSHLFEPFFTTKEVGKGTGMGLPTVYGIVKQNNGFIAVRSGVGKGTVVTIYLPKVERPLSEEERPGMDELPMGKGETVLLVEDEPALLEMAKAMLERFGYRVVSAGTPAEAVRLASEKDMEIHLLMTDVVLPQMNGRDLANRLREIRPGLRCLFMSGYTSDIVAERGIVEKGVQFIQKPFTLNELAGKVRKALGPRPSRGATR